MRLKFIFLTVLSIVVSLSVKAQNSVITEAELMKYAIASDSLKKLTDQFKEASLKITNDPKIAPARQRELALTQGDSIKLVQAKATGYEKAYLKRVQAERNRGTAQFQNTYSSLIYNYVGAETFNKVRTQLKTDPKLKHRFDSITLTLQRKTP